MVPPEAVVHLEAGRPGHLGSTPALLLLCELGLSFFETVCQNLGAKLGALRLPLRLGLGLLRSARQGFSFGVQGFPELVFASLAHFQTFPTVQSWAMRLFAWPAAFDDPTYPRSRDFIRPRVLALPSQPLPTRRTFFTLSSFRALLPSALPCAGSWRRVASRPSPRALHPSGSLRFVLCTHSAPSPSVHKTLEDHAAPILRDRGRVSQSVPIRAVTAPMPSDRAAAASAVRYSITLVDPRGLPSRARPSPPCTH